ncbi:MAG: radical SAM protein [Planctomycetota bacterium]
MKALPPLELPWTGKDIPHAALDILRGCNVHCPSCYNTRPPFVKPLERIKDDLNRILALRRVHTITLTGGETTLHPDLPAIVRHVREKGLRVAMLTNGVTLNEPLLRELSAARLDMILLHIQEDQRRPDLPDASPTAARNLRARKAAMIASHGIVPGLSIIILRHTLPATTELVREVIDSPHLQFLLATGFTNFHRFKNVSGSVPGPLQAAPPEGNLSSAEENVSIRDIGRVLSGAGHSPFACVRATRGDDPRWLSYVVGIARKDDRIIATAAMRPGLTDRLMVRLSRLVTGRHLFFYRAGPIRFRIQHTLGALSGGCTAAGLGVLAASLFPGTHLEDKHFVFQQGPSIEPDGTVVYCRGCPDATILHGRLVPSCLCDRMENGSRNPVEKEIIA